MLWVMAAVNRLFWNHTERRWRAGWRVVLYTLLWVTIQLASSQVIESPLTAALVALLPAFAPIAGEMIFYTINALLVIGLTWLLVRHFDHRSLVDLGLSFDRHWLEDFCFGLLLGAGLVTLLFIAEWSLGWLTVADYLQIALSDTPWSIAIWQPIFLYVAIALNEELLARGYQLRNLAEGLHYPLLRAKGAIVLAWVLSSLFFGFLHVFNPNSTWLSTLALMLVGLFLGLGYVLTGRLGLPIGLHITWNFFLGSVYGFRVSGNNLSSITLIAIQQTGPQLWTGGAFGPEAGLFGLVAILLGLLLTVLWVQWRYGVVALQLALAHYCDLRQRISSHQQGAYNVK